MAKSYQIGRHINGITINPLEYILIGDGNPMEFTTKKAAREYLKSEGLAAEDYIIEEANHDPQAPPAEGEIVEREKAGTSELVMPEPQQEVTLAIVGGITTADLQQALTVQTEQRAIIKKFVQDHLEDGTDFGKIHVMSKDKCPDQYNCKKDYHYSKPVLFKPGQEKLFSLFQITSKLERDEETYKMLPNTTGLVAYKCLMYRNGQQVGEGRGSATVGDNRRDTNATIKIAEKRARMDACLSLGFSEYFAQDLDDPDYKSAAEMANQRAAAEAERRDVDEFGLYPKVPTEPIDSKERQVLYRLTLKAGFQGEEIIELLTLNGIVDPGNMTSGQARDMMSKLKNNAFAAPVRVVPVQDEVVTDIDDQDPADGLDAAVAAIESQPPIEEAELVIDDDLKANVEQLYESLGLNARGNMWFMKTVAGKPFATFVKFTDDDWRKAYETVMAIMDQKMDVADEYVAGVIEEPTRPVNFSEPKSEQLEQVQALIPGAKADDA